MIVPTFWCHLEAETQAALKVQQIRRENPGATSIVVQDRNPEAQAEALKGLDSLSEAVEEAKATP